MAQDSGTLDDDEVSDVASDASGEISDSDNVIIVSGFRQSLNAAISAKREAVGQVDVLVAEGLAQFPDVARLHTGNHFNRPLYPGEAPACLPTWRK